MNKTDKRQLNLRNKLLAAIAMLLVSSIMMVSSTYAWFTLSTAPEVQGITTTVGANGNLEIALMPLSGETSEITSAMGDSVKGWLEKNLTWGNLIDLGDPNYGLDKITLLPAQLNLSGTSTSDDKIGMNPLATPTYGADGRPSSITANTAIGTRYTVDANGEIVLDETTGKPQQVDAFSVNDLMGIRAIGTSSTMSEEEITFNNSISKLATAMANSKESAQKSLNANGATLAEMAINHATAGEENDNNEYKDYIPTLQAVVSNLRVANDQLEVAIKAALLAAASSSGSDSTKYTAAVATITDDADLASIWSTVSSYAPDSTPISDAYSIWEGVDSKLEACESSLTTLANASTVKWNDVTGVMGNLMNTSNIVINGKELSEFKSLVTSYVSDAPTEEAKSFVSSMISGGIKLTLKEDSGVYADLAMAVGDLTATVTISKIEYGTLKLYNVPATIVTDSEPATGSYLYVTNVALATLGAMKGDNSSSVIDVTYGYIVDFAFRTNASGSYLKLQTSAGQRIYSDSANTDTLGHGSTMAFRTGNINANSVKGLMEGIRVVFINPDTDEIYGIAKLDMNEAITEVVTQATADTAEVSEIKAPLYLYSYELATVGDFTLVNFGNKIAEADANLCPLTANTAAAVSAMVYIDGNYVDNEDVANAASSMTGTLNLQFASSATLVPMENSALKNASGSESAGSGSVLVNTYTVTVNEADSTNNSSTTVNEKTKYTYTVKDNTDTVAVTIGGTSVTAGTDYTYEAGVVTIPAEKVTGNIVITVTDGGTGN